VSAPYPGVTKDNHDRRGSAVEILATCSAVCLFHDAVTASIGTAETGALIF
jgi:hypothetical protein